MDAVKRVDLATKLKKKKNKLKNKYQELKKIEKQEEAVLSGSKCLISQKIFKEAEMITLFFIRTNFIKNNEAEIGQKLRIN